ncbi:MULTISPECIES: hypothetical protein [Acetobacter]|uniref:Uncharacterized protein n=1 Tax=Acetobacter lovaniensis TaxID=104100 RepID=A0A841QHM2_9PROT|nr:hypothetical protein [Acetobacter lovaniensis]MBB6457918.1 hypothetical protein [Acetobacter lovaniensis]NHN82178.1 hypothetical protein [Acetobacter lovaniensis]GBQ66167.1 hypothetical protein AA0474_1039 [Acetobacter lovaniensis NRIC 0474]
MADTPSTKTTVAQTATAVTGGLSPLALALALPQPEATWLLYACAVFAGAGFAATQIPLPANQTGKLWLLYRVINFLALNWKYAANAAFALRSSTATTVPKAAPLTGPGSVINIPQDTPK